MLLDSDTHITEQVDNISKLFDTFVKQRKLRCDLVVRDWRFEFLAVHKDHPNNLPDKRYVLVNNLHNPDDVSEEFHLAIQNIHELFRDYNVIPLML